MFENKKDEHELTLWAKKVEALKNKYIWLDTMTHQTKNMTSGHFQRLKSVIETMEATLTDRMETFYARNRKLETLAKQLKIATADARIDIQREAVAINVGIETKTDEIFKETLKEKSLQAQEIRAHLKSIDNPLAFLQKWATTIDLVACLEAPFYLSGLEPEHTEVVSKMFDTRFGFTESKQTAETAYNGAQEVEDSINFVLDGQPPTAQTVTA